MERNQNLGSIAGKNLRRLIQESTFRTQEEFAFEFDVDVKTINRWINRGIYNLHRIEQIAEFFDIDVLDILSA